MIKTLILSSGASLDLIINSDYDYNKRNTDEYETEVIVNTANNKIIICSDYLNFIIKEFLQKLSSLDDLELLNVFKKHKIGMAYNDYLYCIDNEEELNRDYLKENNDIWIGDKFLLFELPRERTTWLYSLSGKHYLEITPLYEKHFLDSDELSYNDFVSKFTPTEEIELTDKDIANLIELLNGFV